MISAPKSQQFCGRAFTEEEVALIREVVTDCGGISRCGIGLHGLRTVGLETPRRQAQGSGVQGFAGAARRPGDLETSRKKVCWRDPAQAIDCDGKRGSTPQHAYRERRDVFAGRCGAGGKSEAAKAFSRACQPIPLPGIRHALWGEASVPDLRKSAIGGSRGGRMHSVFEPRLADEGSGSMDRLGRCDAEDRLAARGQQQPVSWCWPRSATWPARCCPVS